MSSPSTQPNRTTARRELPLSLPLAAGAHPDAGTREAPFSYECGRCNRCCRDRIIQVNPYEVLRLARAVGLATGEFIDSFIDLDRMALRCSSDGTCVFLGDSGCTVHADRPLVCRLYPLGRIVRGDHERWVVLPESDGSEGTFGLERSVYDYVDAQGALPYMRAADACHAVLEEALLAEDAAQGDATGDEARWLLDVDSLVEQQGDIDREFSAYLEALKTTLVT